MKAREAAVNLDLRGVKCPLNWARVKVRLEQMARGEVLELTLDDPRGARDIPSAAEAEGYVILESTVRDGLFHLRIER
ncbi:sulfurtransferase TusA family protein [Candidatus Binatus sp.]|uniref:sulfurtransferase TusA family protein n=1 Tax=Candidatus Binatus sp. TaxID=2811406 RepID=UPI003CB01E3E